MILGLDISTSICGVTILDRNGNVIVNDYWDLRNKKKFPTLFDKAKFCQEKFIDFNVQYPIEKIFIEAVPVSFMRGGNSSAKTLMLLSKFNGIVSWLCWTTFGVEIEYIEARAARKLCGIEVKRGQNAKEVVVDFLLDNVKDFVVEYTRYGNLKPGISDKADSLVIAQAGWLQCYTRKSKSSEKS